MLAPLIEGGLLVAFGTFMINMEEKGIPIMPMVDVHEGLKMQASSPALNRFT